MMTTTDDYYQLSATVDDDRLSQITYILIPKSRGERDERQELACS